MILISAIGCMEASNSSTTNVPPVAIALITKGNKFMNLIVPKDSKTSASTAFAGALSFRGEKIEHNLASPSSPLAMYATSFELVPNNFAALFTVFSTKTVFF